MKIGVIGTGVMASYIVQGFCDMGCEHSFILSPRNREKSAFLASKYTNVTVAKDNQDVLDNCEAVILSVLPQNAQEILSQLNFPKEIKVISVIAAIGLDNLEKIIGKREVLVDVLPLPFISKRMGPVVIYPHCSEIEELLKPMGDLIVAQNEKQMADMRTITALMSPFYQLCHSVVSWGEENGLSEKDAKKYTTSFFSALCFMAANTQDGKLKELAEEMTPGGLNWQAVNYLKENDSFKHWQQALDIVLKRVEGN